MALKVIQQSNCMDLSCWDEQSEFSDVNNGTVFEWFPSNDRHLVYSNQIATFLDSLIFKLIRITFQNVNLL